MLSQGYYPILLVWNSGFYDSYTEHLFSIRQGEVHRGIGTVTWPFVLLTDIGKGLVRLPLTLFGRWYNDLRTAEIPGSERTEAWEDLEGHLKTWQSDSHLNPTNLTLVRPPQQEKGIRGWDERTFRHRICGSQRGHECIVCSGSHRRPHRRKFGRGPAVERPLTFARIPTRTAHESTDRFSSRRVDPGLRARLDGLLWDEASS